MKKLINDYLDSVDKVELYNDLDTKPGLKERYRFFLKNGSLCFLKPVKNRAEGLIQEVAYKIQNILDSTSSVPCYYIENPKLTGIVCRYNDLRIFIDGCKQLDDVPLTSLTKRQIRDILKEFVLDYLLANYNTDGKNLVIDYDKDRIRGLEKEYSLQNINHPSQELPNHQRYVKNGQPQLYYRFFEAVKKGEIKIDLNALYQYIEKIDKLDNNEYGSFFFDYIRSLNLPRSEQAKLLTTILYRKKNLKENMQNFINSLNLKEEKEKDPRQPVEPIPTDYIKGFNELIDNLKKANINFNIDHAINFYNLLRSTSVTLFKEYLDIKDIALVAAKRLGYSEVDDHEKEIYKLLYQNIHSGYFFHITNQEGYQSILENGMDPSAKKNDMDYVMKFRNLLNEKSQRDLFPIVAKDNNMYSYSARSIINSSHYGTVPEWFDFLTGSAWKNNDEKKAVEFIVRKLLTNGEKKETIEKIVIFMRHYWQKYVQNNQKTVIFIPREQLDSRHQWTEEDDERDNEAFLYNFKNKISSLLNRELYDKVDERTSKIVDSASLSFMHLDDCVLRSYDEEKEINKKNKS